MVGLRRALAALMLALLLGELNQALLATATPTLLGELGGLGLLMWVATAYVLTGTLAMPVLSRLAARYGRRRVLTAAVLVFLVGCVLGGLAPTIPVLVVARAVQGLGAGGLLVLVQSVVAELVPARRRGPVLTWVGAVFALGALAGPLLGGYLTESVGWRWVFWVNVPLGLVAVWAVHAWLPESADRPRRTPFDTAGTVALAVVLGVLAWASTWVAPANRPGTVTVLATTALLAVAVAALVVAESRATDPVLPLGLFRRRNFTIAVGASVVFAVALFGTVGYLPLYLQMSVGLTPTTAGLVMLSLVGGLGLATAAAAQVSSRTGHYRALPVAGAVAVATGLALLGAGGPGDGLLAVAGPLALLGAGTGLAWETLVLVAQNTVGPEDTAVATATNGVVREVGVLIGSAVVGGLLAAQLTAALGAAAATGTEAVGLLTLTPERLAQLPIEAQTQVADVYAVAMATVFRALVPVALAGAVLLLFLRRAPLATRVPAPRSEVRR